LLLGSDYPVTTPQDTIDGLRRINDLTQGTNLPKVPEIEIDRLIERDTLQLLGLN